MSYENQLRIRVCSTLKIAKRLQHKRSPSRKLKIRQEEVLLQELVCGVQNCVCIYITNGMHLREGLYKVEVRRE